ncbi:MAG: hypothetical protein H7X95_04830, partial [Deltaproteobacteria bacterium]|nr:hypothetical protein [Deltaproteobacteria bacterium]
GGATATGGASPTGGATATGGAGGGSNPAVGTYGTRANLLASTSEMAVGEAAGKIYVVGGYPSSPAASVTTVAVYTPGTNSWTTTTPYPFPIHHPVVVGVAGKLYSLGGQTPTADTARTFEFDPSTPMWRELAPMPTARGAGAAAAIGSKIYVVGGRPPATNQLEVYDIPTGVWARLPAMPQTFPQRNHLSAVAIGGKVYVAGGRYAGGSFSSARTASLDIFDPVAGVWSLGAAMPAPARGGINGVAAYGCFHIWGGEGTNTGFPNDVFPQHDVYDPRSNTWTRLLALPTPVHGVTGAAFLNGLIYIPGGGTMSGGSSGSPIFQVFRPDPAMRCE